MSGHRTSRRSFIGGVGSTIAAGGVAAITRSSGAFAQKKKVYLTGAGGDPSGVWYPLAATIARLCQDKIADVEAVGIPLSGADVQASVMAARKNVSFWAAYPISMVDAYAGNDWPAQGNKVDVLSWFNAIHPYGSLVLAQKGIESAEQLKGKTVNVMPKGHINFKITERHVLPIYGLTLDDFTPSHMTPGEAVRLMKDGRLDGMVIGAGPGHPRIADLSSFREINLLPPPGGKAAIEAHAAEVPYVYPMEILKKTWPALNVIGGEPCPQVGTDTLMAIGGWLDDDLVYSMTKAVFENLQTIRNVHRIYSLAPETALQHLPLPVHRGALRYYEEQGFQGVEEHKKRFASFGAW